MTGRTDRSDADDERAIVVGGGYAGVTAANRLARHGARPLLVTARPHFVERIRLHRVASADRPHARVPFDALLRPDVELLVATVARVDAADRRIVLDSGAERPFGALVLAVGSGARTVSSGVHCVDDESHAERLAGALRDRPDAVVTVVGPGATGVELACALADSGRRVRLAGAARLAADHHGRALAARLTSLGVALLDDDVPPVAAAGDLVVDATGLAIPTLARDSGLPVDDRGRVVVDRSLRVHGVERVYAAGDAILVDGPGTAHLRPACASAIPLGTAVADVIARGRPRDAVPGYAARCLDLGDGHGRVQFVSRTDRLLPFAVGGRLGGIGKEAICRFTLRWMRAGAPSPLPSWPTSRTGALARTTAGA